MRQKYEYKFVRIDCTFFGGSSKPEANYRQEIEDHSMQGWRLVQVFSPSIGSHGHALYYELIFEREVG